MYLFHRTFEGVDEAAANGARAKKVCYHATTKEMTTPKDALFKITNLLMAKLASESLFTYASLSKLEAFAATVRGGEVSIAGGYGGSSSGTCNLRLVVGAWRSCYYGACFAVWLRDGLNAERLGC